MSYTKLFDPERKEDLRTKEEQQEEATGDRRDGKLYFYDDEGKIVLAVNVALATGRPLLISGPSGGGKSSLAYHVARVLNRRYYEYVVTARTQARDLTWRFDAVRRLADAQVERLAFQVPEETPETKDETAQKAPEAPDAAKTVARHLDTIYPYIEPQALWWIFDRESAACRGRTEPDPNDRPKDPAILNPGNTASAVLLIDEIDKADPDVPNNLLVELGSLQFDVELIGERIEFAGNKNKWEERPLVIITTNRERPLPKPFLRRCVVLEIESPKRKLLMQIAAANFPDGDMDFFNRVLTALLKSDQQDAPQSDAGESVQVTKNLLKQSVNVSIAEYIDTVRACSKLKPQDSEVSDNLLKQIIEKTIWKKIDRLL